MVQVETGLKPETWDERTQSMRSGRTMQRARGIDMANGLADSERNGRECAIGRCAGDVLIDGATIKEVRAEDRSCKRRDSCRCDRAAGAAGRH